MKKKLDVEKLKKEIGSYLSDESFLNYSEDEDKATIHIYLNHDNAYDAISGNSLLNSDIYQSIDETLSYIDKKKKVCIELHFEGDFEDKEKERIYKAFKVHYAQEVLKGKKQSFRIKMLSLVLLIVGALFLISDGLLLAFGNNFIFQNIIEIIAWVFIWEATNVFFFENASNKREFIKNIVIFNADIVLK